MRKHKHEKDRRRRIKNGNGEAAQTGTDIKTIRAKREQNDQTEEAEMEGKTS